MAQKQIIKNMLLATLWTAIGAGTVVLLVAAIQKKDANRCTGVEINIRGVSNNFFVDKNDIIQTITAISGGRPVGKTVGSFNLNAIETALQNNTWIKSAQLFFDNNEKLHVTILEREPVARVFTTTGTTFYIDSAVAMLPMSEKFSARLPVFTNFPSDKKILLKADSNLLRDILTVSMAIQQDSFFMSMIDQVDITSQRTFEMIPKFGNSIIVFGDAGNVEEKLSKLRLFYKEVMVKAGWNKYSHINVQYKGQVVAKRKGADEVKADSLRTLQLMLAIAENAERMSGDSLQSIMQDNEHNTTNNTIILQSIERDDNNSSTNTPEKPGPQEAIANERDDNSSATNTAEKPGPQEGTTNTKPALPTPEQVTISKHVQTAGNRPSAVIKKPAMVKPASTNAKQLVKAKPVEIKKPKLLMPKPLAKKPGATKPVNEY